MENRILISGVNWLGDCIMSMPSVRALKRSSPSPFIGMLSKTPMIPLWRMCPYVDEVIEIGNGLGGALAAARLVRRGKYEMAFVFPRSFRSALVPFLGGVPARIGQKGQRRRLMLTRVVQVGGDERREHQATEYYRLMGIDAERELDFPLLRIPEEELARARKKLAEMVPGREGPLVGVFPGAAYGPAKRWPASSYATVCRQLVRDNGCRVVLFGSARDVPVCREVFTGAGDGVADCSGATSLVELAAMLAECRAVVGNDSGGVHLAAGLGVRTVAIFGITDPTLTSPLGRGNSVIVADNVRHKRRGLEPDSEEARAAMASILPETVYSTVTAILGGSGGLRVTT